MTGRNLLTDFRPSASEPGAGLSLTIRSDLEKLIIELQGLLEERNKLDTHKVSTKNKAAKALWMDRLAEID